MKSKAPTPLLPQRVSLVMQTVQSLSESIRSGRWRGQLPGERELCDDLQVSRTTMRAALRDMQQQGLLKVTDRRRRSIHAGSSRDAGAHHKIVALLVPSALETMHPRTLFVIDAIRGHLAQAGFMAAVHVQGPCFSARPARALEKCVREHPADAWVVFGSKEPMQRWFTEHRLPVLVFGSCQPGIDLQSVDADHRAACHHAGGVLWRKGHRHIALILPRNAYGGELDSEQGLRSAVRDMPGAHLSLLRHDGTSAHVCALLEKAMRAPQPPTAYLVSHAEHALTALTHLMRRGKRIPHDVAIISRDDHSFLHATSPVISHYAINPMLLARRVSLAVRQLVTHGTLPAHTIRLMPKFVPGGTV